MTVPLIIFFLTISILIILVIISSLTKKEGFLSKFLTRISVINGFLSAFAIYITYTIFKVQTDKLYQDMSLTIADRGFLNVNEAIKKSRDKCPNLVNSLYFDWQKQVMGNYSQNKYKIDDWATCNYLSNVLFQAWEDYLALTDYEELEDETSVIAWTSVFMQWVESDKLREIWVVLQSNYSPTTIKFGNYLFEMVKKYKPKNTEEILYYAKIIGNSEIVKNIKKEHLGLWSPTPFD
jgi:hypothetical protein